jgi:hypothetical protein
LIRGRELMRVGLVEAVSGSSRLCMIERVMGVLTVSGMSSRDFLAWSAWTVRSIEGCSTALDFRALCLVRNKLPRRCRIASHDMLRPAARNMGSSMKSVQRESCLGSVTLSSDLTEPSAEFSKTRGGHWITR